MNTISGGFGGYRACLKRVWVGGWVMSCLLGGWALGAEPGLRVYWIDAEGGGATLVVTPAGESILVDTGNPGVRDPGRIVKAAREMAGLEALDHLIVTHFHIDHFGGAAEVAAQIPVRHVHDKGIPESNPDNNPNDVRFPLMIKPYREMPVGRRWVIGAGDVIPLKGKGEIPLKFECLGAQQRFIATEEKEKNCECEGVEPKPVDKSDNANSAVFLLSYGEFRMFIGGDLTWNLERELVCPVNRVGKVDVYQVNHHGLDQSNHPALVRSLAPTVSVMCNGVTKGCGPETFATLKSTPSIQAMFQLHKNLRSDVENNTRDEWIANLERDCDANPITMEVDPSGKQYTIAIPATGYRQTFTTRTKF